MGHPHLYSCGKRYPDMTILSANILPVLGITCQCNVKLNSLPRRLLPCTRNKIMNNLQFTKKLHWILVFSKAKKQMQGMKGATSGRYHTWSIKRYLFEVWIQNFACSLEGMIPSQREICKIALHFKQDFNLKTLGYNMKITEHRRN